MSHPNQPKSPSLLVALGRALALVGEIVVSVAIVALGAFALLATGCAPVEPDGRGGIRTECAADGGALPDGGTNCPEGFRAYCFEESGAGTLHASCCPLSMSAADCERNVRRDR